MGDEMQAHRQVQIYAWRVLTHSDWKHAGFSLRFEKFATDDHDHLWVPVNADASSERGIG